MGNVLEYVLVDKRERGGQHKPLWMNRECSARIPKQHLAYKRREEEINLNAKGGRGYFEYTKARNQAKSLVRKAKKE